MHPTAPSVKSPASLLINCASRPALCATLGAFSFFAATLHAADAPAAAAPAAASTSASAAAPAASASSDAAKPAVVLTGPGTQAKQPDGSPAPAKDPTGKIALSEDFESGQINKDLWDLRLKGDETVTIVQDKVAHGKYALKVHYPQASPQGNTWGFIAAKLPVNLHDHMFGRAYVYVSGLPPQHSVLMNAGTPGFPVSNFLEIGTTRNNKFQPSYQQNGAGIPRDEKTYMLGQMPIGQWYCLEWEFTDKPVDRIIIWVDGKQTLDTNIAFKPKAGGPLETSEEVGGFSEFALGFRSWAAPNARPNDIDIYYDDIAISDKPIGELTPVPAPAPAAAPAATTASAAPASSAK